MVHKEKRHGLSVCLSVTHDVVSLFLSAAISVCVSHCESLHNRGGVRGCQESNTQLTNYNLKCTLVACGYAGKEEPIISARSLHPWRRGVVVGSIRRMNEVNLLWAHLVLVWVTRFWTGIPSRCVTDQLGHLSLASLQGR